MLIVREYLQMATVIMSCCTIVVLFMMVRRGILNWRYTVLPVLVLVQVLIFYACVILTHFPPSDTTATWSSIIRLEMVVSFFVVLVVYWKQHDK